MRVVVHALATAAAGGGRAVERAPVPVERRYGETQMTPFIPTAK
jgi:hypothetical protein